MNITVSLLPAYCFTGEEQMEMAMAAKTGIIAWLQAHPRPHATQVLTDFRVDGVQL